MSASSLMNCIMRLAALIIAVSFWTTPAFAWLEAVSPDMSHVLLERCTSCHNLDRVDKALRDGRDIEEIQSAMVARGAVLSEKDKQILGTFWGPATELEEEAGPRPIASAVTREEVENANQVIERRCLLCHTRSRIDDAIAQRLPFEPMEQMMRSRGATLEVEEKALLKIFWEQPHR